MIPTLTRLRPTRTPIRAALLSALIAAHASGQTETDAGPKPAATPDARDSGSAERKGARPVPDYDGRGSSYENEQSGWLWVPRVVLFPLWVVSEFGVRRPLGWVTVQAERANLQNLLVDWFTWGPDRNAGIVPTTLIDFGFKPSVGVYLFWNDAFAKDNDIRVHAATWGLDWLRLTVTDRVYLSDSTYIAVRGEGSRRPDWLFYGLGPFSDTDNEARYSSDMLQGSLIARTEFGKSSVFSAFAGVRRATFEPEGCCDSPDLEDLVAAGRLAMPPGVADGYTILQHGFTLELDSREPRPAPGSGVRAVLNLEQSGRITGSGARQWLRYGGSLSGFWDVTDQNRVLGLGVRSVLVDPVAGGDIPFTEQVTLGGDEPLRGFLQGRLIDRSALSAKLDYQWPVWTFLDGSLAVEAGNVYGDRLEEFDVEAARLSYTLGVRSSGRRDHPFEVLVGAGTTPLSDGAKLDSFRFVFGASNGF